MFIIADLEYKDIKNPFVKKTIILLFRVQFSYYAAKLP